MFEEYLLQSQEPAFDIEEPMDILDHPDTDTSEINNFDPTTDNEEVRTNIFTTDAGQQAKNIGFAQDYAGVTGNVKIAGHVILNQCGTLLTRQKYQLKGSSRHKYFIQKLVATCKGTSIPLMYPEATMFPSIHWAMAPDQCSVLGCIPSPLLSDLKCSKFASVQSHVRCRLTNYSSLTSSDVR